MNALRSKLSAIARRRSGLSKGGLSRLTIRLRLTLDRRHLADRLRHLALHVLEQRDGEAIRERSCRTCRKRTPSTAVDRFLMIVYSMPSR